MNILELTEDAGLQPKRKASTNGGEYESPCPFCKEGKDRFLIWPNRHNKNGDYEGGRYSCRICGQYGNAITFLMKIHNLSYPEACARLKIEPKERQARAPRKQVFKPPIAEDPSTLWIEKATAFVEWCHEKLMNSPNALAQILERGFNLDTVKRFKIGFNPGDLRGRDFLRKREEWGLPEQLKDDGKPRKLWLPLGFTIPTFNSDGRVLKSKIRRTSWKEGDKLPKYVEVSGSRQCPSVFGDASLPVGIVLESELDGMLLQQEVGDLLYSVALGGSTKPIDADTYNSLKKTQNILFLPDYDLAGAAAWLKFNKIFPSAKQILTPDEKSAGDYFKSGESLRDWILHEIENI